MVVYSTGQYNDHWPVVTGQFGLVWKLTCAVYVLYILLKRVFLVCFNLITQFYHFNNHHHYHKSLLSSSCGGCYQGTRFDC